IVTGFVSSTITKNIMQPIYKIDINNIDESEIYPELLPYFCRIKAENEEKAKTDMIRREFSANVSHELKTPLTSISGYAQMITNGMARPEDTAMFGLKIEKEAERLLLLIDDIIRLSNLDETTGVYEPEEIRLDELARETVKHLEPQLERRDITVEQRGGKCVISGSKTLVSEMVYNLIDNAIKYNKEGGSIEIYTGETPEGTVFSVHDTGIGIAQEDIDRIFERFYRVDKSHSKTVGGTGLGLSIVKHVAMVHNAKIDVSSTLGEGTTISVTFRSM
ncbi:MAG: sensor histidine kinase, partial [Candidatus Ornithomonoglobus sp.]